jgi:exopolysaccharide biosynthesis polyprenyl glycosylphosphotransferase
LTPVSPEGVRLFSVAQPGLIDGATTAYPAGEPQLLDAATIWHNAGRHPAAIGLDMAVSLASAFWISRSVRAAGIFTVTMLLSGLLLGLWKRRSPLEAQGITWFVRPLLPTVLIAGLLAGLATDAGTAILAAAAASGALIGVRSGLWLVIGAARRHGLNLQGTLVIGTEQRVEQIKHRMRTFPEAGLRFQSEYVADEPDQAMLEKLLVEPEVEHVMCSMYDLEEPVLLDLLAFADRRLNVTLVLPLSRMCAPATHAHLGDLSLVPIQLLPSWGSVAAKRAFDLVASLILVLVGSPILLLTAMAIKLGDPGPVIFKQQRVGRNGRPFTISKFRSMVVDAEDQRHAYVDRNVNRGLLFKVDKDPRITTVGAVIRRLSIDELPQLFNVIKGDMSLVGPRPLPVRPDDFDGAAGLRHAVLPGITGLWQVKGANALSYADMVELDLTYVATHSLGLDLMILWRTIPAVFIRRSAY